MEFLGGMGVVGLVVEKRVGECLLFQLFLFGPILEMQELEQKPPK